MPQQPGDERDALLDPGSELPFRNGAELAAEIAQHASRVAFQCAEHLAHAAELPGMGVPPHPDCQAWGQAVVVLP